MSKSPRELPEIERLFHLFTLDSRRGLLLHKKKCGTKEGSIAGNVTPQGYRRVKVDGVLYLCHRIIYLMHSGKDPKEKEIDHINGIKSDSRPANLRMATRSENRQNTSVYKSNALSIKGVWYDKARFAFFCAVQKNKVNEKFGPFNTAKEAKDKYQHEAKERFGKFYRREK